MKKYKIFISRKEWAFIIALFALMAVFLIWFYICKERNPVVLLFQLPTFILILLTQAREIRLHDDDTIELRSYLKNKAFKPISVHQVVSYKTDSKSKNKLTLIYFRNQLRGDWTVRLSEKDFDDLISELTRRNPSIIKFSK